MSGSARQIADATARRSYGRLVAFLSARSGDMAAAEDALAEAFRIALETWPSRGAPDNPEAWLLTVARRSLAHRARHGKVQAAAEPTLKLAMEEAEQRADAAETAFPDERLKLLFICAHPAIDEAARAPLMLQTAIGIDAARIASAFLVSPAAMGQRLVRAKAKIREARIPFAVPDRDELAGRLEAVLDAIYAAYGAGWDEISGADEKRRGLTAEAIWLARALAGLMPDEPETLGLLALALHCEARAGARRGADSSYVPLDLQNPDRWNGRLIDEADALLYAAGRLGRFGRYQCEAAIQSVHAERRRTGVTNRGALAGLYEALAAFCPAIGVLVSRAAAAAAVHGAPHGLSLLDRIDRPAVRSYQPYWAVRAHLCAEAGRLGEAADAYRLAIGLSEDEAVRRFLMARAEAAAAN